MKFVLLGLAFIAIAAAPVAAQTADVPDNGGIVEAAPVTETEDPTDPEVTDASEVTDAPEITEAPEIAPEEAVATLQILDATDIDPEDFLWDWRIVAVMAHSPRDPAFIRQMEDIRAQAADLLERDVVVLFDSDRDSGSLLRQMLRPRGFMLAIIEKDGEIKQRRPAPRDVREIGAAIDHFPLRRQEILERRPAGR